MAKKAESLDEIARRYEAMIEDDSMDEALVPVGATVEPHGSIIATRFTNGDLALISRAAKEHDTTVIDFIRAAALAAAAGDLNLDSADVVEALQDARSKAQELAEALGRI